MIDCGFCSISCYVLDHLEFRGLFRTCLNRSLDRTSCKAKKYVFLERSTCINAYVWMNVQSIHLLGGTQNSQIIRCEKVCQCSNSVAFWKCSEIFFSFPSALFPVVTVSLESNPWMKCGKKGKLWLVALTHKRLLRPHWEIDGISRIR